MRPAALVKIIWNPTGSWATVTVQVAPTLSQELALESTCNIYVPCREVRSLPQMLYKNVQQFTRSTELHSLP